MDLLRGAADGERQPGHAPRARAHLQGHLPPLPHDARLLRRAQGRLGLPRPAGRAGGRGGARLHLEGRHRALRHRGVQREVPRVGLPLRRGLRAPDGADRLLGRRRRRLPHARRLLHRVRLVGAAHDLGQGPAVRGLQGRPLLPALRHRALLARARPAGRLPGRDRPVGVRAPPGDEAGRAAAGGRRAADLDDDAVDARLERGGRRRSRPHLRARAHRRRCGDRARRGAASSACSSERASTCSTASPAARSSARPTSRRSRTSLGPRTARRATRCCRATSSRPRTGPASCTPRSRSARTTSASASSRGSRSSTPSSPTAPTTSASAPYAGRAVREANDDLVEDLRARGLLLRVEDYEHAYPHCWRCHTALLYYAKPSWYIRTSAIRDRLLAVERDGQLAPAARQARALRQLAGGQRRLGALARALLGHAAADVALRARARPLRRLVRRAGGAVGRAAGGCAPARTSTRSASRASSAAGGCSACPR